MASCLMTATIYYMFMVISQRLLVVLDIVTLEREGGKHHGDKN